jgi:flagellar M-ring protein FliF
VENFSAVLNRLGMARIAAMVVVAIMLLGFFALITFRFSSPQMAPLYSGLTFDDSAAIVSELQKLNIDYDLRAEGETILVERNQITQIRMNLAGSGLPNRGQVGYEIFDSQNTLGATSFVQNINQLRALEGELARTISSLARIKTARVHLVIPERELFKRDKKDPTASIVLSVRGDLSASEIRAIQHLTSSSIEGLTPARVSIVDDAGRLLASGAGNENEVGAIANGMQERILNIENLTKTRIEQMLSSVLGPGRAKVQVSAEIDLNRSTKTSESFDPESQVVRSSQIRELANEAKGPGMQGAVSVGNELPGANNNSNETNGTLENSKTTEEVTNYEISKTTQTEVVEAGAIKRISVAVAIDGRYIQDANGASTYEPRTAKEMEQITALIRSAIGFDANRGDLVEVVNMQFAERPELTNLGTAAPSMFDFTRDDLMNAAQMAVTLLISIALMFFVLRPLVKRVLEPESEPLALPTSSEVKLNEQGLPIMPVASGNGAGVGLEGDQDSQSPAWVGEAQKMGKEQTKAISEVGTVITQNPKQAATIVRNWLGEAA